MGKICRNRDGNFVLFEDYEKPEHCIRKIYTVTKGSYNNYYNDYEEIRHYTGEYEDMGFWNYIDNGVTISIENVPEKYLDMTYDSEPRTI
jgi:hypothetical protein